MKPINAPFFPYRGGKARLRRFIVRWLPLEGSTYYEPFAGRANVFFLMQRLSKFENWHLNDLQTFKWLNAVSRYNGEVLPEVAKEDAKAFLALNNDSAEWLEPILTWAGGLKERSSVTGTRGHDLQQYSKRLTDAALCLRQAKISSIDAVKLISSITDPSSFVYLDPPYQGANVGSYDEKMLDRKALLEVLKYAKFRWVLSEYECNDLTELFGEPKIKFSGVFVNPSPSSVKTPRRETEVLYSNLDFSNGPNIIDFGDSQRPFAASVAILKHAKSLNFYEFCNLALPQWGEGTLKAQFARLACLPDAYYDGERIFQC